jgi:ribosomal protein S6--L-glutamate ligase
MATAEKKLKLVSFDIFRSLGMPNTEYMKPEDIFQKTSILKNADYVLFPPHSLVNLVTCAFQKSIFPSVNTYHLGYDKIQMTHAFRVCFPEHTPRTLIYPRSDIYVDLILDQMAFPFVVKEVRNAQGKGIFLIHNRNEFLAYAKNNEMLYAQEYLEIDRDLRVVWVGDQTILAYWRIAPQGGFLNNVAAGGRIDYSGIPDEAIRLVSRVCRTLKINHAGFDVAEVNGHYYLFEYNLFFGTQALDEKMIPLTSMIYTYLITQTSENSTPEHPFSHAAI